MASSGMLKLVPRRRARMIRCAGINFARVGPLGKFNIKGGGGSLTWRATITPTTTTTTMKMMTMTMTMTITATALVEAANGGRR